MNVQPTGAAVPTSGLAAPDAGVRRRGPFVAGDLVQLTDAKGRHHTFPLVEGKQFHTTQGGLEHDELIGGPEGVTVRSTGGAEYLALRPLYTDFVLSMKRGATIVYPKDAAMIVGQADIFPGAMVVEAGVGSGALSIALLQAIGPTGQLHSFEIRDDFAKISATNVAKFFGGQAPDAWDLTVADLSDGLPAARADGRVGQVDRVVLDMLAPWECVVACADALLPGGIFCAYVATTTQLSRTVETLRSTGRFAEPVAFETLLRTWHVDGLAVRPDHRMQAHTGFVLVARRLADGTVAPVRRRRPSKGAHGPDWNAPVEPFEVVQVVEVVEVDPG